MTRQSRDIGTPVVLFDNECRFCDASVNWIIAHDRDKKFRFAAGQSKTGKELLCKFNMQSLDSVILAQDGKIFTRSDAVLQIARALPFPWFAFYNFIFLPTFLRDPLYNAIASHRYRWFGKTQACRLPAPDVQERFLN